MRTMLSLTVCLILSAGGWQTRAYQPHRKAFNLNGVWALHDGDKVYPLTFGRVDGMGIHCDQLGDQLSEKRQGAWLKEENVTRHGCTLRSEEGIYNFRVRVLSSEEFLLTDIPSGKTFDVLYVAG